MRLLRLELKAFGPFTDRVLDFSTQLPGLHLVFGPNEAGKSSSLRALKALLFGFPAQTPDNFLHNYDQLVVAGSLRNEAGAELSFQRRKKRVGDILDAAGNPLDPAVLTPFLHGLAAPLFVSLYGIDHDALVQGGEEILARKGEVGQALFAAGAGLSSAGEIIAQLQKEGEELFKERGVNQPVNAAIRKFKDLQKEARSIALTAREWQEHRTALDNALAARTELERERDRKNTEMHRLERVRQAIPELAALQARHVQLQSLGEVVLLDADFAERYQQVARELREGRQRQQVDTERVWKLEERRKAISYNDKLVEQAEKIDDLHQRLGEYRKGRKDRPERNGMRISLRTEAGRLLQLVRPDLPLEKVEVLRLLLARKRTIQALASQHVALTQQLAVSERRARVAEEERCRVQAVLAGLPVFVASDGLLQAAKLARMAGDIDGLLAKGRRAVDLQKKACEDELARIGLWHGELIALMALALPLSATVHQFDKRFGEIDDARRQLESTRKSLQKELQQVRAEIRKVELAGDVPREEDLLRIRARRGQGWQLVRRQWLDHEDVGAESREFAPDLPLAEVYEDCVEQADSIADRLRREADRVAGAAALHARMQILEEELLGSARELEKLVLVADQQLAGWQQVWRQSGIHPLSPKEMASWLVEIDKLRFKVTDLHQKEDQLRQESLHRAELLTSLAKELAALGEKAPGGEELGPAIVSAENLLARMALRAREEENHREKLGKLTIELRQAAQDLQAARAGLDGWRLQWRNALVDLGRNTEVTTLEALDLLEALQGCFDKLKEAEDLQKRIDGIDRDAAALDHEVKTLLAGVDPALQALPLEQAILQLRSLLGQAQKDGALWIELTKDIEGLKEEMRATGNSLHFAGEQMSDLLRRAKCENPEDVPAVISKFNEYQRLREKIVNHEENLAKISGGASIAELADQAAAVVFDALPGKLETLARDIRESLNPEINRLSQVIGEETTRLAAMDGGARAAEVAEQMERELAKIRRLADRYTLVKLAARVLQQAIDRYREEHQDPVLRIAADHFHRLTLGSFAGLRADVDDSGQPILVGVRPNGSRLTVDKMSSGSRDQMFLSLRLASLLWRMQTEEPMPFIIDDILINFDDLRSRATLQILADLGARNQVILFTHHRRLVDEVRLLEGAGEVRVHDLSL